MSTLSDKLKAARLRAQKGGIPARRKDSDLYKILAEILDICQDVDREGLRSDLIEELTARDKAGRNRIYVYPQSDNYVLTCRYVLEGEDNRNSIYRYAASIREAAKRQIRAENLASWLKENGGINTLFKSRPLARQDVKTSTIHLNEPITAPKGKPMTITIMRDARGFFDLIAEGADV